MNTTKFYYDKITKRKSKLYNLLIDYVKGIFNSLKEQM